jgi:NitT/TauT family transport system substrate-binding protein
MRQGMGMGLVALAMAGWGLAACGPTAGPGTGSATDSAPVAATAESMAPTAGSSERCAKLDPVRLQLKWTHQAQFGGYYAAEDQGYFDQACLEVTVFTGGPEVLAEDVVTARLAEFGIDFLPSLLAAREAGQDLVNIAQVFERSGTRQISWQEAGIHSPADLAGKRVAVWMGGNQYELMATLAKAGLNPATDLTLVPQPVSMDQFLNHEVDSAAAMTYNELATVLEAQGPDGQPYTMDDLSLIDFNAEGTAMLQDGIIVNREWLDEPGNREIAVRFLTAAFRGWIHCRDQPLDCVESTLARDASLDRGHQTWMMNEVNQLIWPSVAGLGQMSPQQFQQTAEIAHEYGVIREPATADAYTTALSNEALANVDPAIVAAEYVPLTVEP